MKPEVKGPWVERLRSGQDQQGADYLHREDGSKCCLGVLCAQAVEAGVIPSPVLVHIGEGIRVYAYGTGTDENWETLPGAVMKWAGLGTRNPVVTAIPGSAVALSELNDSAMPFWQIAGYIEADETL